MQGLLQDTRYALRMIARRPALSVVIILTLAKKYWPGEDPVGRRVLVDGDSGPTAHEIVGIVGDVRSAGLEEPVEGEMYFSSWQGGDAILCLVLRTSGDPSSLAGQLRAAVWSVDREQPVTYVMAMSDLAAESLTFRRAGMMLAGRSGPRADAIPRQRALRGEAG
jgi:hypothetical protein